MKQSSKRIIFLVSLVLFLSGTILLYHMLSPSSLSRLDKNTVKWDGSTSLEFSGGNGTEENPYIIDSGSDIAYLKARSLEDDSYLEKHYALEADIDLNNIELNDGDESKSLDDENKFKELFPETYGLRTTQIKQGKTNFDIHRKLREVLFFLEEMLQEDIM